MKEQTLILIKPDGVTRGLTQPIMDRIKQAGFMIVKKKEFTLSEEMAKTHYREHKEKPFFPSLIGYITSGPIVAMVVEGEEAISGVRTLMGPTNPAKAPAGTIRGDLKDPTVPEKEQTMYNLIHGSDSAVSATRELALFFPEK